MCHGRNWKLLGSFYYIVLDKNDGPNYHQNKQVQNEFLKNNASVAYLLKL